MTVADPMMALVDAAPVLRPVSPRWPAPAPGGIEFVNAADVAPRPVRWLWPHRIPIGKMTLIAGDPGLGKSILLATLAAHLSRGRPWPVDGNACPVGSALLLSAEDDPADTVVPRLLAAGADPRRVSCAAGMIQDGERRRGLCLDRDIPHLAAAIEAMGDCRLLAIDPPSAFLGGIDSHSNAEVRGVLGELSEMAQKHQCAIVLNSHLNKGGSGGNAIYRATGSLAFVAAARAAFIVAKDKSDPKRRLFLPTKNNLSANDGSGLAYRVVPGPNGAPVLAWEPSPVTMTADEALAGADPSPRPREAAADWLRARLAGGPVAARDVFDDAAAAGIAKATLNRAKKQLGVGTIKTAGAIGGGWVWRPPAAEGDHEGDQNAEGDHWSTARKLIPFGTSDPLRRVSHPEEDQQVCLGGSDDNDQRRWSCDGGGAVG